MNKPTFYMMIGLPASGKSYYAHSICDLVYSSDDVREELYNDVNNMENNNKVFDVLHQRIRDTLIDGKDCVYDATNMNWKLRRAFLESIKKIECYKVAVVVATQLHKCLSQNSERERKVPEDVIYRMLHNFTIPYYYEGWDKIKIVRNEKYKTIYNIGEMIYNPNGLIYFHQDNSNHTLTLGEHLSKSFKIMCSLSNDKILREATLIHDIGKPFTKTFYNKRNELTDEAHYYEHQNIGAYQSLFMNTLTDMYIDDILLERAFYIQWHMLPFFLEKEKTINKYKNLFGEEKFNNIMLLHQADLQAK